MCELLAVSTSRPARLAFSLHTLASRGSPTGGTRDGWGVAFHQGDDVALFREPGAAGDSALVRFLESHGPATGLAISHIRHATQGSVRLANTQPFVRQLGGRTHVFAHNGDLSGVGTADGMNAGRWQPVGDTDSERAFCALLAQVEPLWAQAAGVPSLQARLSLLADFATGLRRLGPANFLYSDGDALFAHGHRRIQPALGRIEPPGLWTLQRQCAGGDEPPQCQGGASIMDGDGGRTVQCVASVPLTDEAWRPLAEGELLAVRGGQLLAARLPD